MRTAMPRWLRAQRPTSSYGSVVRGATSMAVVMEALWFAGDPALWPTTPRTAVLQASLWLVLATWAGLAITHLVGSREARRAMRFLNVLALAAATLLATGLATVLPDGAPDAAAVALDLCLLASTVAGLLLPFRAAVLTIGALAAGSVLGWLIAGGATAGTAQRVGFAVVAGLASAFARQSLVREAHHIDDLARAAARREVERLRIAAVAQSQSEVERLLHATVLNTLVAIERGGLSGDLRERLRARCRESALVVRELVFGGGTVASAARRGRPLEVSLATELRELRDAGVDVHLAGSEPYVMAPERKEALASAVREALANVARHAEARRVTIVVESAGVHGALKVIIRDDGRGFQMEGDSGRFGVAGAIQGPVSATGGTALVESRPGRGTTVTLNWPELADDDGDTPTPPASTAGFVVPVLALFAAYSLVVWWGSLRSALNPGLDALAFALLLVVYGLLIWASRRGVLTLPVVAVALLAAPLIYSLAYRALGLPAAAPGSDWATFAVLAIFMTVAAAGPRWAWPGAWAVWLVMQGNVLVELVSAGSAAIVGAAIYGLSSRSHTARFLASVEARAREEATLESTMAAASALRLRYSPLSSGSVVGLLEGIAMGQLDPDDSEVRSAAAAEERFIRTLLRYDPDSGPLAAFANRVAGQAHRHGVLLRVDLAGVDTRAGGLPRDAADAMMAAVRAALPGTEARLTVTEDSDGGMARLVATVPSEGVDIRPQRGVEITHLGPDDEAGHTYLWEARVRPPDAVPEQRSPMSDGHDTMIR